MADRVAKGTLADIAAMALTIGIMSNTIVKLTIALVVGRGTFRAVTALGLGAMAAALAASLWLR
jgi:hypothetical protein